MKLRHSKPATDEDELETATGASTEVSTPQAASTGNWKCPSCGAENEDYRTFCDGCGDKRPGAKVASKGIDMASLLGSSESSDDTSSNQDKSSSWEDSPKESPKKEKGKKGKKNRKNKDEDDEEAKPLKAEPLEQEKIEPPESLSPSSDFGVQKPSFVLSGPTAEPEPNDSQTAAPSPPVFEPSPMTSFQQTSPQTAPSGSHYYLVFVNTPASSLLKTRVSIDFDDFPTITIGRSPENVVVIPDQEVSRKHASLSFSGSRLMLKDLGSLNGTFLYDGKEFQRVSDSVEVKPNNVLKLGTGTIVKLVSE